MKKIYNYNILIFTLLLCVLQTACSSDDETITPQPNTSEEYKVTFDTKNLIVTELRSTLNLTSEIKYIEYWVYNQVDLSESSPPKTTVKHDVIKPEDIGKAISFEVGKGDYQIIFFAADQTLTNTKNTHATAVKVPDMKTQLFSAFVNFSVNSNNVVINQPVDLVRKVCKIEIFPEDLANLPQQVKSVTPVIDGYCLLTGSISPVLTPETINLISPKYNKFIVSHEMFKGLTIPRSKFASITKDTPITFYYTESVVSTADPDYKPNNLYLIGSKTENPDMFSLNVNNPSDTYFVKPIKKLITTVPNSWLKYTGKIGNVIKPTFVFDVDTQWNEVTIELK